MNGDYSPVKGIIIKIHRSNKKVEYKTVTTIKIYISYIHTQQPIPILTIKLQTNKRVKRKKK